MMFRERPRALCARALARFSHVPGAAGRDRGARVVTGGAKRTRRREDPTEPECGDVRTDLSQWWHSRTNPSARGYPNELISWRRAPNEPEVCVFQTNPSVRIQTNPSAGIRTSRLRASARTDRSVAQVRTNPSGAAVRRTRVPTELHERTRAGRRSKRTRAVHWPNEPERRAAVRRTRLPTELHERTQAGSRSERTRAVHWPNEPERRGSSGPRGRQGGGERRRKPLTRRAPSRRSRAVVVGRGRRWWSARAGGLAAWVVMRSAPDAGYRRQLLRCNVKVL